MHHSIPMLLSPFFLIALACNQQAAQTSPSYIAFTGATIIDGSGTAPIADGVLLIRDGRIASVGTREEVELPAGAEVRDVTGKTIIPGLINTHGHVGDVKGIEGGHYSRENIRENLAIYARYGITTVVSLGGDRQEAVPLRWVNDTTGGQRARLYTAGAVVNGNTADAALAVVDSNHRMGVDFMKIRVDDNLGTSKKMSEAIYKAIIDRSHELSYQVAVHLYYLEDAKKLLAAGGDLLVHSVRDQPVDQELVDMMQKRKTCYCPTLTRELSTYVYEDTAGFFSDPFFLQEYNRQTIQPLLDPERQREVSNSYSAQTYKQQLPVALANLKILADAGVPLIMGTDSGMPARFMGYFEHLEMEMMVDAGLNPMDILQSATGNAEACMKLKDVGLLKEGYWADFVILSQNPLDDIRNTRSIEAVWIGGEAIQR